MTISFHLDDLRKTAAGVPLGPADKEALEALGHPDGEAAEAELRRLLGRVADGAAVRLEDGMVTLTWPEAPDENTAEAERLMSRAVERARKGELSKAVGILGRVLELDPGRHDARRNLAMALNELGRGEEAEDALLDVLKVDPTDAEALVILGNRYARMEDRGEEARRLFERACELEPDNPVAGNSLAGALLEAGLDREALEEFDRVLGIDPGFANAHYGRSMVFLGREAVPEALAALRAMFAKCELSDPRLGRMLEAARDTFLKLTNIVGNDRAEEARQVAEELRKRAEEESGVPVRVVEEKLEGTLHSSVEFAWDHGLDHHKVAIQSQLPAVMLKHHALAHEAWHILLESGAREADCRRLFVVTREGIDAAVESMHGEIRRIVRKGNYDEGKYLAMIRETVNNTLDRLLRLPTDMAIERQLAEVEALREAQFCALTLQAHNAASMTLAKGKREVLPAAMLKRVDALNGAMAVFIDRLTRGATDFARLYQSTGNLPLASKLEELVRVRLDEGDAGDGLKPGAWYGLVDEVAGVLGMKGWHEWSGEGE
ncbi:tetratricopeptide repeat protein [Haloferula sp. A504]|uniref:tetratricopeptide repeat protein n=1 Tax=Haloferula sp. A504 TaxID=3373601 RepID=UPI0031C8F0E5|nr:tetratricopeptide repeat protein [Verrucomicrobiaceae bacterium E54]